MIFLKLHFSLRQSFCFLACLSFEISIYYTMDTASKVLKLDRWKLHGIRKRKVVFVTKELRLTRSGCSKTTLFPLLIVRKQCIKKKKLLVQRLEEQLCRDVLFVAEIPPLEDCSADLESLLGGVSVSAVPATSSSCETVNFDVVSFGSKRETAHRKRGTSRAGTSSKAQSIDAQILGRIESAIEYAMDRGVVWAVSREVRSCISKTVASENVFDVAEDESK